MKISNNINDLNLGDKLIHRSGESIIIAISEVFEFADGLDSDQRQLIILKHANKDGFWTLKATTDLDNSICFKEETGILVGFEEIVDNFKPYF